MKSSLSLQVRDLSVQLEVLGAAGATRSRRRCLGLKLGATWRFYRQKLEQKWRFYHQEWFLIDRNSETKFVFTIKKKVVNSLVSRTVVDILFNEIQQASTI